MIGSARRGCVSVSEDEAQREHDEWAVVLGTVAGAPRAGLLGECACGAPKWEHGKCGQCRLVAAETVLWKLRMASLIKEKMIEVLKDPTKGRAAAWRALDRRLAKAVALAPGRQAGPEAVDEMFAELAGPSADHRYFLLDLLNAVAIFVDQIVR